MSSLLVSQRTTFTIYPLITLTSCSTVVLRNPVYFIFLIMLGAGAYITYTLNLWGPMLRMADAASKQALEVAKERLREFLENSDTGRQAMAMSGRDGIKMSRLDGNGKKADEDEDVDEI